MSSCVCASCVWFVCDVDARVHSVSACGFMVGLDLCVLKCVCVCDLKCLCCVWFGWLDVICKYMYVVSDGDGVCACLCACVCVNSRFTKRWQ